MARFIVEIREKDLAILTDYYNPEGRDELLIAEAIASFPRRSSRVSVSNIKVTKVNEIDGESLLLVRNVQQTPIEGS